MTYRFRTTILPVLCVFAFFASLAGAQLQPQFSIRPRARVTAKIDRKIVSALRGTHPAIVDNAMIGTRLNAGTQLQHMVLVLQPSEEQNAALASLMDAQQDKNSGSYHKWLTPDTFGQTFGVAPADVAQVSAWLSDSGLSVESVSRSGRFVTFSGSVGTVETAFHTEMHRLTMNGESHISNISDVSIPAALASVVKGVARLNDFFPKSSATQWRKVSIQKNTPNSVQLDQPQFNNGDGVSHFVGAGDLATIYNATPLIAAGNTGQGITISVLGRSNISLGDVAAYRSFFGLPNNIPNIIVVGQDPGQNGDDIEASLDAEMAGSLASGAKVNFIVSAVSLVGEGIDLAGLYAVDNNAGDIITLSYGGCETNNGAAHTAFWNDLWEEAAAQGQTVFVSTGDSGAAGCSGSGAAFAAATRVGVNALGSSAFNVAVGGSMFVDLGPASYWNATLNTIPYASATGYIPEAAWNEGQLTTTDLDPTSTVFGAPASGIVGGGGGVSIFTSRPSWQTGSGISATTDPTPIAAGATSGLHRLVPDLSFIASSGHDGTIFCAEGICSESASGGLAGAGVVGGTSVATPAMASAQALIDAANGGRQGNANYYYYALANSQYVNSVTSCQAVIGTVVNPAVTLPASSCNFQDIVAGSNIVPTSSTDLIGFGFSAGPGFDEATGLGSVNIANVAANWHTVTFNSTTTSLSLTPATIAHGAQQIAAVQVTSPSGTPTGDVSIVANSLTAAGTPEVFRLTGGAVNGIVDSLPAGSYNVHAHYAGDGVFAASDSPSVAVNIAKEDSAVSFTPLLVTSGGSVNAFASVPYASGEIYLDAEFGGADSGKGTPSGTVTFALTRNGSPMAPLTAILDSVGTGYLLSGPPFPSFLLAPNYPTLPAGNYSVVASYSGDTTFNATSATATFAIAPASSAVTFTTGTASIVSGGTATLNISIASAGASAALATGTVTFTDTTTGTNLGTATVTNGKAALSTTSITTSGAHSISATYSGDNNYTSAAPAAVTVTVNANTTTTTVLTSSIGTPEVGNRVTLTGTVSSIPATSGSTVSFYDGGAFLGSGGVSTTTGQATLTVTNFGAGIHGLTAIYSGNALLATSTASLSLTVTKNLTNTRIGGTEVSTYGQSVFLNGSIVRQVSSQSAPVIGLTGTVRFFDVGVSSATFLGSATPTFGPGGESRYTATFSISTLGAGSHTLVAQYSGDANYGGSTSGTAPLTIAKANQTINFTGLPAAVTAGSPVSFTLNGTASSGLPVTYTVSGPATLSGTKLTVTATGPGTIVVKASQAGNANYNAATPVTQTIVVGTVQLAASAVLSFNGTAYQAVVTVKNNGTATAQNVQLTVATLGAASATSLPASFGAIPSGGSASVTLTFPASAGTHGTPVVEKLTGTYTGGTFGGSFRATLPNSQQPS